MSHLSILPTVLDDAESLIASLRALGLQPCRGGVVAGFGGEQQAVEVSVQLADGHKLGWQRQRDGALALVADLQRIARSTALQRLLERVTRSYAAHAALRQAAQDTALSSAEVLLHA